MAKSMNLSGNENVSLNMLMGKKVSIEYAKWTGILNTAEIFIQKHTHLYQIQHFLNDRHKREKCNNNVYNLNSRVSLYG